MKSMLNVKWLMAAMLGVALFASGCGKTTDGGQSRFKPQLDGKIAGVEILPAVAMVVSAVRPDLAPYVAGYMPKDKNGNPVEGIEPTVVRKWMSASREVKHGDDITAADIREITTWEKEVRLSQIGREDVDHQSSSNTVTDVSAIDLSDVTPEQIAETVKKLEELRASRGL